MSRIHGNSSALLQEMSACLLPTVLARYISSSISRQSNCNTCNKTLHPNSTRPVLRNVQWTAARRTHHCCVTYSAQQHATETGRTQLTAQFWSFCTVAVDDFVLRDMTSCYCVIAFRRFEATFKGRSVTDNWVQEDEKWWRYCSWWNNSK
jgi:hypothetical protein